MPLCEMCVCPGLQAPPRVTSGWPRATLWFVVFKRYQNDLNLPFQAGKGRHQDERSLVELDARPRARPSGQHPARFPAKEPKSEAVLRTTNTPKTDPNLDATPHAPNSPQCHVNHRTRSVCLGTPLARVRCHLACLTYLLTYSATSSHHSSHTPLLLLGLSAVPMAPALSETAVSRSFRKAPIHS